MKLIQKFRNRSHPAEKKPQNGHTDSLPANTEKSTNSTDFKDVSTADSCRSTNEASDLTEETVASERDTDLELMHEQRLDISFIDSAYFFGIFGTDLADYGRKFAVFLPL